MEIKINFQIFGLLRDYFPDGNFSIIINKPMQIYELKQVIFDNFKFENLDKVLETCAIASEHELLSQDVLIEKDTSLLIFPPVSGG